MLIDPVSEVPPAVPDGNLVGSTATLNALVEPAVPVVPVVLVVDNHPPELVVPTVKLTGPPVLVTVSCCAAGAEPVIT